MAQVDTTHEEKPQSAIHTKLEQHKIDVALDWVAIPTIAIVLLASFHLHFMLTAGDWDFWTDWKDRRWWPLVTPVVLITFPAAVQYITWERLGFRLVLRFVWLCSLSACGFLEPRSSTFGRISQ